MQFNSLRTIVIVWQRRLQAVTAWLQRCDQFPYLLRPLTHPFFSLNSRRWQHDWTHGKRRRTPLCHPKRILRISIAIPMAFARIPARIVALQDQLTMRKLPPKTLWRSIGNTQSAAQLTGRGGTSEEQVWSSISR